MIWNDENWFYNQFKHIWLKNVFDFENCGFGNVLLTKVVHVYVIEDMNA